MTAVARRETVWLRAGPTDLERIVNAAFAAGGFAAG